MKRSAKLALFVAAAGFALLVGLAPTATADVVDPRSPFQPVPAGVIDAGQGAEGDQQAPPSTAELLGGAAEAEATPVSTETQPTAASDGHVRATPAPEVSIRAVPAPLRVVDRGQIDGASRPLETVLQAARTGIGGIRAFLGQVASACQVSFASGAGAPVLVLGVLGMAAALDRRRVLMALPATDEDVPEFLYAQEVIAPG